MPAKKKAPVDEVVAEVSEVPNKRSRGQKAEDARQAAAALAEKESLTPDVYYLNNTALLKMYTSAVFLSGGCRSRAEVEAVEDAWGFAVQLGSQTRQRRKTTSSFASGIAGA